MIEIRVTFTLDEMAARMRMVAFRTLDIKSEVIHHHL